MLFSAPAMADLWRCKSHLDFFYSVFSESALRPGWVRLNLEPCIASRYDRIGVCCFFGTCVARLSSLSRLIAVLVREHSKDFPFAPEISRPRTNTQGAGSGSCDGPGSRTIASTASGNSCPGDDCGSVPASLSGNATSGM